MYIKNFQWLLQSKFYVVLTHRTMVIKLVRTAFIIIKILNLQLRITKITISVYNMNSK